MITATQTQTARTVSTGFLRVNNQSSADADFEGLHFSIVANGVELGVVGPNALRPCQAGDTLDAAAYFAGSFLGQGPATVDGASFPSLSYGGTLQFVGGKVTLTPELLDGGVMMHVSFAGQLEGYLVSAAIPEPPEPSIDVSLAGHTLLHVDFVKNQGSQSLYTVSRIEYVFGEW